MMGVYIKCECFDPFLGFNAGIQLHLLFFLLYEKRAVRISPPLTISDEEIKTGCAIIVEVIDSMIKKGND